MRRGRGRSCAVGTLCPQLRKLGSQACLLQSRTKAGPQLLLLRSGWGVRRPPRRLRPVRLLPGKQVQ